jgi:hypothetical protein
MWGRSGRSFQHSPEHATALVHYFYFSGHLFREHPLVNALDDLPDFRP